MDGRKEVMETVAEGVGSGGCLLTLSFWGFVVRYIDDLQSDLSLLAFIVAMEVSCSHYMRYGDKAPSINLYRVYRSGAHLMLREEYCVS